MAGRARIRLYLPGHLLRNYPVGAPQFYPRLLAALEGLGAVTEVVKRPPDFLDHPVGPGDFDLVHMGRQPRPQSLNIAPTYLPGFYYLDPKGVNGDSAITDRRFFPMKVPEAPALRFLADLRRQNVDPRRSKLTQPRTEQEFGQGHLAIFLQDWSEPVEQAQYVDGETMVRTVVEGAQGRPVVVKPHPRHKGRDTRAILRYLRGRPEVTVTNANVHDILKGAAACISISSSLALEGMLHGVPAVLFGRSDLHHCATTVRRPEDWPAALDQALGRTWPFARYLLWFLRWQNIDAGRPFLPKVLERMAGQGADFAALGITLPAMEGSGLQSPQ